MMDSEPGLEVAALVEISDSEFQDLARLVYDQFGINLTDKKKSLVRGRLNKVLKSRGLKSFAQYLEQVRTDQTGMTLIELIDRISTNHTFFFREVEHFNFFQDVALDEINRSSAFSGEMRIWCAGCATGEEAYTLAMLCLEWASKRQFRGTFKILATDISVSALEHAVAGEYTDERVRLVPQTLKQKYFQELGPDRWVVKESLKKMILFKRLNFMDPTFPFKNHFHAIFCRNVMIYFDRETKNDLVRRLTAVLSDGHYFFIGHSETLGRDNFNLKYVMPSVYKRADP